MGAQLVGESVRQRNFGTNHDEVWKQVPCGAQGVTREHLEPARNTRVAGAYCDSPHVGARRQTPRQQLIDRFTSIIQNRKRNEDTSLVKYWKSYGVAGKQGRLQDGDFSIWIDWMVKTGELQKGQLTPQGAFTNSLNAPG